MAPNLCKRGARREGTIAQSASEGRRAKVRLGEADTSSSSLIGPTQSHMQLQKVRNRVNPMVRTRSIASSDESTVSSSVVSADNK